MNITLFPLLAYGFICYIIGCYVGFKSKMEWWKE
jgi:hypothetical protein